MIWNPKIPSLTPMCFLLKWPDPMGQRTSRVFFAALVTLAASAARAWQRLSRVSHAGTKIQDKPTTYNGTSTLLIDKSL